ncbi:hypothetical protein [Streptomyces sp. NPDC047123]|uniref:hypothetical protein n=1 Tax=Streptomyces sp. NPDC047123 TaxID=3155622 RepID=UPI0033F19803
MRPRGDTVRAALLAFVLLCIVPLVGVQEAAGPPSAAPAAERGADVVAAVSWADARVEDRGCHEGRPGSPRDALALSPDQPGSHVPRPASVSSGPGDDAPALAVAAPPDVTSVDLHRIQISRT